MNTTSLGVFVPVSLAFRDLSLRHLAFQRPQGQGVLGWGQISIEQSALDPWKK